MGGPVHFSRPDQLRRSPVPIENGAFKAHSEHMTCNKLAPHYVEKPWGRTQLPPMFRQTAGKQVGEIWFTADDELPLLAKYLFTSEALSVQVHPSDAQAREQGFARGKTECWYILDADPGAEIGLGFRRAVSPAEVRDAIGQGSVEELMAFHPVRAGDFIFVEPGSVHAIGEGICLLEFQQNSDLTFRLYDYGRPRELHVDQSLAVARLEPFRGSVQRVAADEQRVLVDGPAFTLVHSDQDALEDRRRWVLPLKGSVRCGEIAAEPGECLLVEPGTRIDTQDAELLIGAEA
jgi:mannose-6-phosphate isomerase